MHPQKSGILSSDTVYFYVQVIFEMKLYFYIKLQISFFIFIIAVYTAAGNFLCALLYPVCLSAYISDVPPIFN